MSLPPQGSMSLDEAIAWEETESALLPELLDSNASLREQAYEAAKLENAIIEAARNAMFDASAAAQLSITNPLKSFDQRVTADSGSYAGNAQKVIQDCVAAGTQLRPVSAEGGCFVAGTLVHTKEGLIPIERIKVGDWVLSQPEMKGEVDYKRVVRTLSYNDKDVVCVDVWRNGERSGFVVTGNHPFWVHNSGWTRADHLISGKLLELPDGGTCEVYNRARLYRTDVAGLAWLDGFLDNLRGSGRGRTIDLRGGVVRFNYEEESHPEIDPADQNSYLRTRVFNFEVEDNHTYYVGEWGVWVHNANCVQTQVALVDASRSNRPQGGVPAP